MKIDKLEPARKFVIGARQKIEVSHTANISLEPNEQVTFIGKNGSEVDVMKKEWGYYLTPSLNKRLTSFEITTYLVQNSRGNIYVMGVEADGFEEFNAYLTRTEQKIILNLSDIYCAS